MNIYTISFFAHRYVDHRLEIDDRLDKLLHALITQREYIDFLIGRDGEFDLLASSAIKRAIRNYSYGNTHFPLGLSYMKVEYCDNEKRCLEDYDEIEICSKFAESPPSQLSKLGTETLLTDQIL